MAVRAMAIVGIGLARARVRMACRDGVQQVALYQVVRLAQRQAHLDSLRDRLAPCPLLMHYYTMT